MARRIAIFFDSKGIMMPPVLRIGSRGGITMPPEIRQRLGLKGGDRVEFAVENGQVVVRRHNKSDHSNESRESHRQALSKAK